MERNSGRLSDGLARQNIVLMSGIALAPVAACATNFENALALALGFTLMAFPSVFICRFIPKKIVYTVRVILYALISALFYAPAHLLLSLLFVENTVHSIGLYLAVTAVSPLILTKTETRFALRPVHLMCAELLGYIAGFDIVCIAVGVIRDVLVNSRIGFLKFSLGFEVSALETTFGGLMFAGAAAGLFRALYTYFKKKRAEKREKEKRKKELLDAL